MLQIIAGRSGTGKTEWLHQRICQQAGTDRIILLVPEQSTFQNERRILSALGAKKAAHIQVLSFKRLYSAVTDLYGGTEQKRIDDGAKTVLMSLAAEQTADRLVMYNARSKRSDFADLMTGAVNEFKMCAITPERLMETASHTENRRLRQKLTESAAIYASYEALLLNAYDDPDDDLTRLYSLLSEHPFFQNHLVFIDDFYGFSGQEQKILKCILRQAREVTVALCCDQIPASQIDYSIFREPGLTLRLLTEMARENGVQTLPVIWLEKPLRFQASSLAAVEESVFRFDGDPYSLTDDAVHIYEAMDEYDEIRQVAREIQQLVRQQNYAFRDITVILRQPDVYKNIVASEFPKYHIPYFLTDPQLLEEKPLIRLIMSAFAIVHSSFSTESILTYLKTDLTSLNQEEVCTLENYAYLWDIKGKRWKSPFTMNPDGNVENINEERLDRLENLRKKAIVPLLEFASQLEKASDGGEISEAVYRLLVRLDTPKRLRQMVGQFNDPSEWKLKETEARIWDITMELLDKMHTVLGSIKVDSKRYAELLKMMIRKNPLADIPQTLDHVLIGTAGNIRSQSQKAVFLIGALEGSFPVIPVASGLFSDSERTTLIGMDLPLYDAVFGMSLKEKLNIYAALSMPSERLYVSRYLTNAKGEHCEPSVIIKELCAMFPELTIRHYSDLTEKELYFTEEQSFEELALRWHDNNTAAASLQQYFRNTHSYAPKVRSIDDFLLDAPYRITSSVGTSGLFGEKLSVSASQTETYYQCPFRYYCRYGLQVFPRQRADMDAGLYGSAVHYILEQLLKQEDFEALKTADESVLLALLQKYIRQYLSEIGGRSDRSNRFMAQFTMIQRNLSIVLKQLMNEFRNSEFVPSDFELTIGSEEGIPAYELELPDGKTMRVVGKVDRVDTYVQHEVKYLRIVDYKTGNKKFRLSDVLYGLNIQMLLYLSILEKNGESYYSEAQRYALAPAGILYMPSTPTARTAEYHSEQLQKDSLTEQKTNLKMNGFLINDPEILSAMEKGVKGIFIPAKLSADGKLLQADRYFADLETYGKIFSYVDKKLSDMGKALFAGRVERNPVKGSDTDACATCDYKTVCGFEEGKPSRKITTLSTKETIAAIEKEEENHG